MQSARSRAFAPLAMGLALALLVAAGPAEAKKPSVPPREPPPAATGTIVYNAPDDGLWTMDPDGGDKAALDLMSPSTGGATSYATVSKERHNGKLWLLQACEVEGDAHPDGAAQMELFVIGEGDTVAVQLTDDSTMAFSYYMDCLAWGPGDSFVSWVGLTWAYDAEAGTYYVSEAGIYVADLSFDASGNITGLSSDPVLVAETETFTLQSGRVAPRMRNGHDWSPDGTQVLYHYGSNELRITDVASPANSRLLTNTAALWCGAWSSTGVIAFSTGLEIKRIDPDGSGEATVLKAPKRTNVTPPMWSPDGKMFAYGVLKNGSTTIDRAELANPKAVSLGTAGGVARWLED